VGKVTIFHHFIGFRRYGEIAREDTSKNDARDAFPLLFLKYYNVVIWLTVRGNTFGRNRIGLARNDYPCITSTVFPCLKRTPLMVLPTRV
jgi:hypothetical protein